MSLHLGAEIIDCAPDHAVYFERRMREEVDAAASANSHAATLLHVALATAYAEQCCQAGDQAWIAETRLW